MSDLQQLKQMIDTLQRRQFTVKKQVDTFNGLLAEVAALQARADTDPEAVRKLTRLNQTLTSAERSPAVIAAKVAQLKKTFDELGKQLTQLASGEERAAAKIAVPGRPTLAKKHQRAFI